MAERVSSFLHKLDNVNKFDKIQYPYLIILNKIAREGNFLT